MKVRVRSIAVLLVLIIASSLVGMGSATAEGSITILWDGYVYDINDLGQAVGRRFPYDAVMWDKGEVITLWEGGQARAINNRGQVVGTTLPGTPGGSVVMWDKGELITLWEAESWEEDVYAEDINELGQVVGWLWNTWIIYSQALMWDRGELITLWEGGYAPANAINDRGQVVGRQNIPHVLWDKGELVPLGFWWGVGPTGINDRGQVVGRDGYGTSYLWEDGEVITLPFVPLDINDLGQAVGHGFPYDAVMWDKGELTTLWEGMSSRTEATAINNRDQVVGTISDGGLKAVLWQK